MSKSKDKEKVTVSIPTEEELKTLKQARRRRDGEQFHFAFDEALEAKLLELDPEWMRTMNRFYERSNMGRWYA